MDFIWLYSACQCVLFVCIIAASVRLCLAVNGPAAQEGPQGAGPSPGSVSSSLRLCLGWVGALGGAVAVPVNVLLNLRSPQCLYTCVTLVCCPLLIRQFTMCLFMLLTLDQHLQHRLADKYSSVVTRQRAVCVVLLCWLGSVLSSFSQFISSDTLRTWSAGRDPGTSGLVLDGNGTASPPHTPTPDPHPKYPQEREVIGRYLPYGGFLSKFFVGHAHNFTYAEIHGSHWGVCAPDTVLTPQFLVYVHGVAVFLLPALLLLFVYVDLLLCKKPRKTPPKDATRQLRPLALSLCLLVLLCLPLHSVHALQLFSPDTDLPVWAHAVIMFLFQMYGLVPQLLFTPAKDTTRDGAGERAASFPLSLPHLPPPIAPSRGKAVGKALREAVQAAPWCSAKHSFKAKVHPGV